MEENAKPNGFLKYCTQITDRRVSKSQTIPLFLSNILRNQVNKWRTFSGRATLNRYLAAA